MANNGHSSAWNPQIWADIDKAVMSDIGRVRVAQKVFPSMQKPGQDSIQADILTMGDAPGAPMMIKEGITVPFLEISAKYALTQSQMENEASLRTAQTLAQLSARKVGLAEDILFFQGNQAQLPPGVTVSNTREGWTGLLNMPGMLPAIEVPPLSSGGYGEHTFTALSKGIGALIAAGHPGPYALILETSMFADTHAPVPNTLVTTADRINPLVDGRFYGTGTFPAHTGLLVSLGGTPTTIYISQDTTVNFTGEDPFGNQRFRVLERVQVVVREPESYVRLNFASK